MKKSAWIFTIFILIAIVSLLYSQNIRRPASQNEVDIAVGFDLRQEPPVSLYKQLKKRLIQQATWLSRPHERGLVWPNTQFLSSDHTETLFCEEYLKMKLIFQAEGLALSGEIPRMTLETNCPSNENEESLRAIWIPIKKIRQLKALNQSWGENGLQFTFSGLDESWPLEWSLIEAQFFTNNGVDGILSFTGTEVFTVLGQPLSFRLR